MVSCGMPIRAAPFVAIAAHFFTMAPPAIADELQVAILVGGDLRREDRDQSPRRGRERRLTLPERAQIELNAFEDALRALAPALELALVRCEKPGRHEPPETVLRDFGGANRGLAEALDRPLSPPAIACPASVDVLDAAVEKLSWSAHAPKRIVAIGAPRDLFVAGRSSLEEVVHRAERHGIVIHALAFRSVDVDLPVTERGQDPTLDDMTRFLRRPTLPLGRVPSHARHATLLSGGSYEIVVLGGRHRPDLPRMPKPIAHALGVGRLERALSLYKTCLEHAFGILDGNGRDALDDLAEGKKRPSEITNADVPAALADIDLEPLLDAVFDFVDARRAARTTLLQLEALDRDEPLPKGAIGIALAQEVAGPRRLVPSRR